MKVHNKILENLRSGIKLSDLDDSIIDEILNGNIVRLYRCDSCGNICDEDGLGSQRTDMECYYGVGSDFPDHHYQNLIVCDNCGSDDIEELGLYELEDFEDYELFEGTRWKHIAGPRYKHMDEKYERKIIKKLFPMLRQYGINMLERPIEDNPGNQLYIGRDENDRRVYIEFINKYEPGLNNREAKYDMFVKAGYDGQLHDAGVIDLFKKNHVEAAFELITMVLEDTSNNEEDQEEKKEPEVNKELDDLANFKNSLSEQELLEIEV